MKTTILDEATFTDERYTNINLAAHQKLKQSHSSSDEIDDEIEIIFRNLFVKSFETNKRCEMCVNWCGQTAVEVGFFLNDALDTIDYFLSIFFCFILFPALVKLMR